MSADRSHPAMRQAAAAMIIPLLSKSSISAKAEAPVQQTEKTGPNGKKTIQVMIRDEVQKGMTDSADRHCHLGQWFTAERRH
jgi:hypothetical protein